MTRAAFFDVAAGIAGDMCLGALVDAGWPLERLRRVVDALELADVTVEAQAVRRGALAATKVEVHVGGAPADGAPGRPPTRPPGRATHPHEIVARIRAATALPSTARADAVRVFEALARAEARVHGTTAEAVHFHEVGAADALVDVVGTCVGLRELDVTEVRFGALPFGSGRVPTAHGPLPLPAPAVVHLLLGHPVVPSEATFEQVTPTGAALVAALGRGSAPPAGFVARVVGTGAGTYDGPGLPNVVRLLVGDVSDETTPSDAVLLEANLDDATGQEVARALERALEAGALDVWATPVTMKKGRPGLVVSVLTAPADVDRVERVLFAETPTLGVRRGRVARTVLARRHVSVETAWGSVRIKVRTGPDGEAGSPEYEDARVLAERHAVPVRRVLEAARAAYAARTS